jgi:hypothetical protein
MRSFWGDFDAERHGGSNRTSCSSAKCVNRFGTRLKPATVLASSGYLELGMFNEAALVLGRLRFGLR